MSKRRSSDLARQLRPYLENGANAATATAGGVTDHGLLTGRTDDDHPQYINTTRGDARYVRLDSGSVPQHSITDSASHSVTGQQYDIVGLTAANTIGLLTPSSDGSSGNKILITDNSGDLIVGNFEADGDLVLPHWTINDTTGAITSTDPAFEPTENVGVKITPEGRVIADVINARGELYAAVLGFKETVIHASSDRWTYGGGAMLRDDVDIDQSGFGVITINIEDAAANGYAKRVSVDDVLYIQGLATIGTTVYTGYSATAWDFAAIEATIDDTLQVLTGWVWLRVLDSVRYGGYWQHDCEIIKAQYDETFTIRGGSGIANYGDTSLLNREFGYVHVTAGDDFAPRLEIGRVPTEPWNDGFNATFIAGNLKAYEDLIEFDEHGVLIVDDASDPEAYILVQPRTGVKIHGGSLTVYDTDSTLGAEIDADNGMSVYVGADDVNAYQIRMPDGDVVGELNVANPEVNTPTVRLQAKWHEGGDLVTIPHPTSPGETVTGYTSAGSRCVVSTQSDWNGIATTGAFLLLEGDYDAQSYSWLNATQNTVSGESLVLMGTAGQSPTITLDAVGFRVKNLPTSAGNLPTGYLYSDSGTIKVTT